MVGSPLNLRPGTCEELFEFFKQTDETRSSRGLTEYAWNFYLRLSAVATHEYRAWFHGQSYWLKYSNRNLLHDILTYGKHFEQKLIQINVAYPVCTEMKHSLSVIDCCASTLSTAETSLGQHSMWCSRIIKSCIEFVLFLLNCYWSVNYYY